VEEIAKEAYIFGYPLVLMDVTRQGTKGAINRFTHSADYPKHTFTNVVSINVDMLYSNAWLDLSREPLVLSVPDTKGRYYIMQMLDAWTNVFAAPGSRTTGTGKADFAIVGPGFKGMLPPGLKKIESPTNLVWIIGRYYTLDKADFEAVYAIQSQVKLTPLSAWGKTYTPPAMAPVRPGLNVKPGVNQEPPVEQMANMPAQTFFARLNSLMQENPPAAADAEALKRFASIGIAPGKQFRPKEFSSAARRALEKGVEDARQVIGPADHKLPGNVSNHSNLTSSLEKGVGEGRQMIRDAVHRLLGKCWSISYNLGAYGTNYLLRAVIAKVGLGANLPEDAIYAMAKVGSEGMPLSGKNKYVIHFAKDQFPPVNAYWSVTLYNNQQFLVDNPLNRYAIRGQDKLTFNADGSLDMYIQHESPGKDRESNWLPAPKDGFNLVLRLYWPKKAVLDRAWNPPPVQRVD
jgi:hypothetical protein